MKIRREQVTNALNKLPLLLESYKTPMARFVTDCDGWIIEVEHLENHGERRLKQLLAAGKAQAGSLVYVLDGPTGKADGRQFFVKGLRNGTFVKSISIRDQDALNVF